MYFVYLLLCKDDSIYTGITTDIDARLQKHKDGTASHYTRARGAVKMLYSETQKDRSSALKREAEIKRWSRAEKLAFVATHQGKSN